MTTTDNLAAVTVVLDKDKLRPKLPKDYRFCDVCTIGDQVVMIITSESFPVVEAGEPIPDWSPDTAE